jgi:hypothetical protein
MKVLKIVSWVFSAVGTVLLIASVLLYSSTSRFIANAASAQGKVIDLVRSRSNSGSSSESTYRPVVVFTSPAGRHIEFTSGVGSNPPSHTVGEDVTVLYDPSNPNQARIKSFFSLWFGCVLVLALGVIFAGIGFGMIGFRVRSKDRAAWLTQNGKRLKTDVTGVELNQALTVNGRSPYQIVSQLSDAATNTVRVFHSGNIWFDPSEYIKSRTVDVFVDPGNPKKYVMDTGFLPQLSE